MKFLFSFLLIIFCFSHFSLSQTNTLSKDSIQKIFKEINSSDKTHIGEEKRKLIFITNFNKIIDVIKFQGYPNFDSNNKKLNKLISNTTQSTLLHILQTSPE
jgi:negative regulator of genetic competence, sporulation and motility